MMNLLGSQIRRGARSMYTHLFLLSVMFLCCRYYLIDKKGLIRDLQEINTETNTSKIPKTLIYITTHMSQQHKDFLKYCWPLALKHSKLLSSSDIMVYMSPDPDEVEASIQLLKETFSGHNLTYHIRANLGYHAGAKDATRTASENGWFDGYEWVFRSNPDVIIQSDKWMLHTMLNDPDASLMYVECHSHLPPKFNNTRKMMTDFFAFKPSALPNGRLPHNTLFDTEDSFTQQMIPIIEKRQHRHIPDTYPMLRGRCRMNGNMVGPVVHFHDTYKWIATVKYGICPAQFY